MKTNCLDPNVEVEKWKDAVYEETKNMSRQQLNEYFSRKIPGNSRGKKTEFKITTTKQPALVLREKRKKYRPK